MENSEKSLEHLRFAAERLKSIYRISKQDVVNILLVSQGLKPTTEAQMLFKENTKSDPREEFERNVQELEQALSDLGLTYDEQHGHDDDTDMESVHFFIAKNEDMKNELVKIADMPVGYARDREIAKMYGFPESAVDAFTHKKGEIARSEDLPEEMWNSRERRFASFLPSKEHWREELDTVREKIQKIEAILPGYFDNL
jgi:hypothetical protein